MQYYRKKYRRGEPYPPHKLMRLLAKSNKGRFDWHLLKGVRETAALLPNRIGDWTLAQRYFVHWSSFYDSVYESYKRPPDRVVLDDTKLEVWLKSQENEANRYAEEHWSEARTGAIADIKTAWDHDEVVTFGEE